MNELFGWLVDTTIKGSILIAFVAAMQWLVGAHVNPRWRHLLWVVVLLRLLLPDVPASSFSVFNALPDPTAQTAIRAVTPPSGDVRIETMRFTPLRANKTVNWLVAIWLTGVALFALRMLISAIRMQRAIPRASRDGGLPVIETSVVRTPALHGLFRPVLLLPPGFRDTFTADELRHVVLHETWHVRRMDVAVSWLLAVAQAVHWFNPFVWFAASRIREERELACDELALSLLEEDERPGYGRTILKLLERFRTAAPVPALVGIVNQKHKMKRRLLMIASFRNGSRSTLFFLMLVAAVSVAGLTDGEGPKIRRFVKTLDPAATASVDRLNERVSLGLTKATFAELLNTVSNKTGLPITQDPAIATLDVQNARFTIEAENVPAHMVLIEALAPFELTAQPTAAGATITSAPDDEIRMRVHAGEGEKVVKRVERKRMEGQATEEFFIRKHVSEHAAPGSRREIKIQIDQDGVKSQGRLTVEIEK